MNWTRVRDVYADQNKRMTVFDVDLDLQKDANIKAVRRHSANGVIEFLFDPTTRPEENGAYKIED